MSQVHLEKVLVMLQCCEVQDPTIQLAISIVEDALNAQKEETRHGSKSVF